MFKKIYLYIYIVPFNIKEKYKIGDDVFLNLYSQGVPGVQLRMTLDLQYRFV